MTIHDELPLADTSDMVDMHRVFRKALSHAPDLVGSETSFNPERVAMVGSYYSNVLRLLHVHHEGEDELLTPKLIERRPREAELIMGIAGQHREVLGDLQTAESCLVIWQSCPDDTPNRELLVALMNLDRQLTPHLDMEEAEILPLAAQCINVAEWGELPSHGMQHFDGDKLWLAIGLIRDEMSPGVLAEMDDHLPPPVTSMWEDSGERLYRQFTADLFSGHTWN